jgi:exopolyphosphatase/guanosine-5'-triphosphate,3'-diphosphate pyrophosphatase
VPIDGRPSPDALLGMGGAITNIAAMKLQIAKYDPDVIPARPSGAVK